MRTTFLCFLIAASAGCPASHKYPNSTIPNAPLGDHYEASKILKLYGTILRDLSTTNSQDDRGVLSSGDPSTYDLAFQSMVYGGIVDGEMCFTHDFEMDNGPPPAEELIKNWDTKLFAVGGGVWFEAVGSLEELANVPAWPPPATATKVTRVKILSDEVKDTPKQVTADDGSTTTVQLPRRFVNFAFCAPAPTVKPTDNAMVFVMHLPPNDEDQKPVVANYTTDRERTEVAMQHDAVYFWNIK